MALTFMLTIKLRKISKAKVLEKLPSQIRYWGEEFSLIS